MQAETEHKVTAIRSSIALLRQHIGWDESVARLSELEREAEDQALWDNPERAQTVMREKNRLDRLIGGIREMEVTLDDAIELITLGEEEGDESIVLEAESSLTELEAVAARRQIESLLSGEADGNDCFVEINAGAGGTEAQDMIRHSKAPLRSRRTKWRLGQFKSPITAKGQATPKVILCGKVRAKG